MSLMWIRIDTNLPVHDKTLSVLDDSSASVANRYRALFSYVCSICWSAEQATDGVVPTRSFPIIHATQKTAGLLVDHGLWDKEDAKSWTIHNYAERQQTTAVVDLRRREGQRAACLRWHGEGCWGPDGCSRSRRDSP